MRESSRHPTKHSTGILSLPRACTYSLLIGLLASVVLLLIATTVSYIQADPNKFAFPAALASLYLALCLTGIAAARSSEAPIVVGSVCSGIWLALLLLVSLIYDSDKGHVLAAFPSVIAYAGIPASVMLGVLIGKKKAKRPSSRNKIRRR